MTMTKSEILKEIDRAIALPMSKKDALAFLDDLQSEIEIVADALREDVAREERGDKAAEARDE
jgi:hypothetical protein